MRPRPSHEYAVPRPGTTEAIELGCTCQVIGHVSDTDEQEPAGMLEGPDPNCPLHGAAAEPEEHD